MTEPILTTPMIGKVIEQTHFTDDDYVQPGTFFGKWIPRSVNAHITIYAGILAAAMQVDRNAPVSVCAVLNDRPETRTDKYENEWNGFWQFVNLMQFTERFVAICTTGLDKLAYLALPITSEATQAIDTSPAGAGSGWDEIREMLFDEEAITMSTKLQNLGIFVPDKVGYELADDSGAVIATFELAWTDKYIGFMTNEQSEDREKAKAKGWKIFTDSDDIDITQFGGKT